MKNEMTNKRNIQEYKDSPEFKKWFGQSVTTDKEGNPQRFYHSTKGGADSGEDQLGFDTFNLDDNPSFGAHFGSIEQANDLISDPKKRIKGGERVYPVHLAVKNPIRMPDYGGEGWEATEILGNLRYKGLIDDATYKEVYSKAMDDEKEGIKIVKKILTDLGYDSIVYLNRFEGITTPVDDYDILDDEEFKEKHPEAHDSYIVFDKPSRIKSAIGNRGTWDSSNRNITKEDKMRNTKRLIEQAIQSKLPGAVVKQIRPITEAKKPSAGLTKKEKSSVVKKAKAGKDIGKKGKGFDAVAKKAGGGEKGKKIAAAAMWKNIKREDVNEAEVTDYNPKSQGGTRKELLAKLAKTGESKWATAARKAGATQAELKSAREKFTAKKLDETSKPDYLDLDKDGNKTEPMKRAAKEKKVTEEEVTEKAKSKKQQQFFGVVNAMQKGDKPKTGKAGKAAKEMSKKDVKDFASTKHKGLPKKSKSKKVEETGTSSGAVATTNLPILGDKKVTKKEVGNGIYESLLKGYRNDMIPGAKKQMLNEGMSVTVSNQNGQNTLSINADGEEAMELMQLLKMAGLDSQQAQPAAVVVADGEEPLDENKPNWPTKPETFQDTPTLSTYSGGLNKPKTTGQSTVPVLASQKDRQIAYEDVELERSLFQLYNNYKGQ